MINSASEGDIKTVKQLLEKGANINAWNKNGQTALHEASRNEHADIVKLLIDKGMDVNIEGDCNETALHEASRNGHTDTVQLLIDNGADIESKELSDDQTPLHWSSQDGHIDSVRLLLDKGADVNAKNKNGQTALDFAQAQKNEDIVKLLKESGAKNGKTKLLLWPPR